MSENGWNYVIFHRFISLKELLKLKLANNSINKIINENVSRDEIKNHFKTCEICLKKRCAKYSEKWGIICHKKCLKENLLNEYHFVDKEIKAYLALDYKLPYEVYNGYSFRREIYQYKAYWIKNNGLISKELTYDGYLESHPDLIINAYDKKNADMAIKSASSLLNNLELRKQRSKNKKELSCRIFAYNAISKFHKLNINHDELEKISKNLQIYPWYKNKIGNYFDITSNVKEDVLIKNVLFMKKCIDYAIKHYVIAFKKAKMKSIDVSPHMINMTNCKWDVIYQVSSHFIENPENVNTNIIQQDVIEEIKNILLKKWTKQNDISVKKWASLENKCYMCKTHEKNRRCSFDMCGNCCNCSFHNKKRRKKKD